VRGATAAAGLILVLCGLLAASAAAEPPPRERELYLLHCSGCHGADGLGAAGVAPSLHGLGWMLEVEGGRAYVAAVPGAAQAPISDAELAALLDHVFLTFSGVAPEPSFDVGEVAGARRVPVRDPESARARLVARRGE
jgi:hypothetical protein